MYTSKQVIYTKQVMRVEEEEEEECTLQRNFYFSSDFLSVLKFCFGYNLYIISFEMYIIFYNKYVLL